MEIIQISLSLIIKSLVLSARWACLSRRSQLFNTQSDEDLQSLIKAMNDMIEKQEVELELLRKQVKKSNTKPRYKFREKLMVLWYMEYFDVPRCQISK